MQSVEQALAELGRGAPDRAADARAAWQALTSGDGPGALTQWRLQQYLWDELAAQRDAARGLQVARALADLLDALGMPRYAGIARSETTTAVLTLAEQNFDRARSLARRAAEQSGIEPPSTELVTWGGAMGPAEAYAIEAAADRLEMCVAVGDLVPRARGWRDLQSELTIAVLTAPQAELDGRSLYDEVLDERLEEWVRGPGSTTRNATLAPVAARLATPVPPPTASSGAALLRSLNWLLGHLGEGITLTAAGYLPPRTVAQALDDLGWRDELIGAANREVDAYPVLVLRETAMRLGLVRRRGSRLLLSPAGRLAVTDGRALWTTVAGGLVGPDHSALAVAWEVTLAVLEQGSTVPEVDVRALVHAVVTESGWRAAGRRQPVGEPDTDPLFFAVLRELRWLELIEESGALMERELRPVPGAADLFRAALRHRVLHRDVVGE